MLEEQTQRWTRATATGVGLGCATARSAGLKRLMPDIACLTQQEAVACRNHLNAAEKAAEMAKTEEQKASLEYQAGRFENFACLHPLVRKLKAFNTGVQAPRFAIGWGVDGGGVH